MIEEEIVVKYYYERKAEVEIKYLEKGTNYEIQESEKIEGYIGDRYEAIQKENNRTPAQLTTVYLMKNVEIPITIVECGFLSNPQEEKLLQTDEYQDKLAWGIYNGIMDYFYAGN